MNTTCTVRSCAAGSSLLSPLSMQAKSRTRSMKIAVLLGVAMTDSTS